MPYLSIVAPAHNEEENIEEFVRKSSDTLKKYSWSGEIIIVDDASTDKTAEALRKLTSYIPELSIIRNPRQSGITASIRRGFERATGDIIIFLPSDLESNPEEDIPKLLEPLGRGYDVAMGWRYNKKEGKIKLLSSKLFNFTARLLFGIRLNDMGWVRAFRRELLREVEPLRSDWHRFFAIFAASRGYKIAEVKTNFYPRTRGKSKFGKTGFGRALGAFLDLLVVKFLLTFSKRPMFIFGTLGLFFLGLGFLGGLYLLYLKLAIGHIGERIPLLFLVMLLINTGIQLFAFGFLAEMLASIKDRTR